MENLIRSFDALIDSAREMHRNLVIFDRDNPANHSSLVEDGEDKPCEYCGHINEAEYELAELQDNF